ncbi:MAG TPA: ABC transporter substrate-binding protein [Burkholderiaceae bacterium]|nr:ABC transporter substrate-binding protein [Burkholderiaceae bacterium]
MKRRQALMAGAALAAPARVLRAAPGELVIGQVAQLAEARPLALLNLMGTDAMETLVRERVIESEGLPVVGMRTGAVALHEPVQPWLFHTRASYRAGMAKVLRHFATIGANRIALVHEASAFGQEVQRHADAERPGRDGFVTRQPLDLLKPDIGAAVEAISRASAQAVLLAAPSPQPTRTGRKQALETLSAFDVGGYVIELSRASHSGSRFVDIAILDRQGKLLR